MLFVATLLIVCICNSLGQSESPSFSEADYEVSVNETYDVGGGFLNLSCSHSNSTVELTYMLMAEDSIPFTVHMTTGELMVTRDLDYERTTHYNFTAVCSIEDNLDLNATSTVTVRLLPVNEHRPTIESINMIIPVDEFTPPGLLAASLPGVAYIVSDMDQPQDDIYYTLVGEDYEDLVYNETLRGIVLTRQYDRENASSLSCATIPQFQFRVTVCDIDPPTMLGQFCPNIVLTVSLAPSNDNDPVFTQELYSVTISEDTPPNSTIGSVTCTDADICRGAFGGLEIINSDPELANTFSVDNSGNITTLQPLDYERNSSYTIIVRCYDSPAQVRKEIFTRVQIDLTDVNDNAPRCPLSATGDLVTGTHQQTTILRLVCTDEDKGTNGQLTFTADGELPQTQGGQFSLNSDTGELTFTGEIDSSSEFNLSILVSDRGPIPLTSRVQVRITVTERETTTAMPVVTMVGTESTPMLVIIVACVMGGLLVLSCLALLCCCCCFCCLRRSKSKSRKTNLSNLSLKVTENVYVETQTGERNVNLFLTDGSDSCSLQSHNMTTDGYTVTNTTVVVGDEKDPLGLVEAIALEFEAKEASMCFKSDEESLNEACSQPDMEQQQPQDPQLPPMSQTCQDTVLDLSNTEITQV